MKKEDVIEYAKTTCMFVKRMIDEEVMQGYSFVRWGGMMQNKSMNTLCCELAGVNNWWKFCEDTTLTSDDLFNTVIKVSEKLGDECLDKWNKENYFITRLIKTRVAFSDEMYLDAIGCRKNPNKYDQLWDNEIGGILFDMKNTYVPDGMFFNDFKRVEDILNNPSGFIKTLYKSSSSTKGGSERGEIGKMNGRFFIINHSDLRRNNMYLIESGYNARYRIFDEVVSKFSDKNVFELDVLNNSDGKTYRVKSSILVITQNIDGSIQHFLLES